MRYMALQYVPGYTRRAFLHLSSSLLATLSLPVRVPDLMLPDARFDITAKPKKFLGPLTLNYRSGWQSFGFDSLRNCFYYVQAAPIEKNGGITTARAAGQLRIGYFNLNGGHSNDFMQFDGFGHGGTTGIEAVDSGTYIWMETNGEPQGANNYGRRICCIKWHDKASGPYKPNDIGTDTLPESHVYELKSGSTENSVNIDPVSRRLILRFRWPGGPNVATPNYPAGFYYSVYNLADIRNQGSKASPLHDFISETALLAKAGGDYYRAFQGVAIYGEYGYILMGEKTPECPTAKNSAVTLVCFRLDSESVPKHLAVDLLMGEELLYREPEGIAIVSIEGSLRLCYGLKSESRCDHRTDPQLMTMYYHDRIIHDSLWR